MAADAHNDIQQEARQELKELHENNGAQRVQGDLNKMPVEERKAVIKAMEDQNAKEVATGAHGFPELKIESETQMYREMAHRQADTPLGRSAASTWNNEADKADLMGKERVGVIKTGESNEQKLSGAAKELESNDVRTFDPNFDKKMSQQIPDFEKWTPEMKQELKQVMHEQEQKTFEQHAKAAMNYDKLSDAQKNELAHFLVREGLAVGDTMASRELVKSYVKHGMTEHAANDLLHRAKQDYDSLGE